MALDEVICLTNVVAGAPERKLEAAKTGIMTHPATVLELMHVKTTKIVKKKSFEVERVN